MIILDWLENILPVVVLNRTVLNRNKKNRLVFALFLLLCHFTTPVQAEKKVALVIGNAEYQNSPLTNPTNDALDMTAALRKLNFEVDSYTNLDRSSMRQAIRTFGEKLKNAEVGLFYYAGHGVQINGRNYLVPLKTDISSADEVQDESIDAGSVLRKMESADNKVNIVILDACRNNPFARSFRNISQGLARMDAPVGSYIAYATAPGSVAADGAGRNGIYTKYLLEALNKPGLAIEQTFKSVRNAVKQATDGKQIPWESSSLMGEFVFFEQKNNKLPATIQPPAPLVAKNYLQVITNVPNAKVIINNIDRGVVNNQGVLNVENILEDHVEVLVQADGYKTQKSLVALVPNQWEQLNIPLTPIETKKVATSSSKTDSNLCFKDKKAILSTRVEFNSEQGKQLIKRNVPELKILLMQALTKYGLKFSNVDLSDSKNYRAELAKAVKQFKPDYLFRFSSSVNEAPIAVIKTNMKTISGDMNLELINVKTREIVGHTTKSFTQAGMDKRAVLKNMLKKQVNPLSSELVEQVCVADN